MLAATGSTHTKLVEAELRRAIGLSGGNVEELRLAVGIAEDCGAVVKAARLHHELGELTGDRALAERGLAELERIVDVDQLERYLVRRGSTTA